MKKKLPLKKALRLDEEQSGKRWRIAVIKRLGERRLPLSGQEEA